MTRISSPERPMETQSLQIFSLLANCSGASETKVFRLWHFTPGLSTPEQGAKQLVWLAESQPKVDWQPGEYYEKGKISKTHKQASDPVLAREFWDISAAMLGIQ
jgi:hypothetical protein